MQQTTLHATKWQRQWKGMVQQKTRSQKARQYVKRILDSRAPVEGNAGAFRVVFAKPESQQPPRETDRDLRLFRVHLTRLASHQRELLLELEDIEEEERQVGIDGAANERLLATLFPDLWTLPEQVPPETTAIDATSLLERAVAIQAHLPSDDDASSSPGELKTQSKARIALTNVKRRGEIVHLLTDLAAKFTAVVRQLRIRTIQGNPFREDIVETFKQDAIWYRVASRIGVHGGLATRLTSAGDTVKKRRLNGGDRTKPAAKKSGTRHTASRRMHRDVPKSDTTSDACHGAPVGDQHRISTLLTAPSSTVSTSIPPLWIPPGDTSSSPLPPGRRLDYDHYHGGTAAPLRCDQEEEDKAHRGRVFGMEHHSPHEHLTWRYVPVMDPSQKALCCLAGVPTKKQDDVVTTTTVVAMGRDDSVLHPSAVAPPPEGRTSPPAVLSGIELQATAAVPMIRWRRQHQYNANRKPRGARATCSSTNDSTVQSSSPVGKPGRRDVEAPAPENTQQQPASRLLTNTGNNAVPPRRMTDMQGVDQVIGIPMAETGSIATQKQPLISPLGTLGHEWTMKTGGSPVYKTTHMSIVGPQRQHQPMAMKAQQDHQPGGETLMRVAYPVYTTPHRTIPHDDHEQQRQQGNSMMHAHAQWPPTPFVATTATSGIPQQQHATTTALATPPYYPASVSSPLQQEGGGSAAQRIITGPSIKKKNNLWSDLTEALAAKFQSAKRLPKYYCSM